VLSSLLLDFGDSLGSNFTIASSFDEAFSSAGKCSFASGGDAEATPPIALARGRGTLLPLLGEL
jgi:hypothetical protein